MVEDSTAALNWSATNASDVAIDPLGAVDASGSRTLTVAPQKSDFGPVDETVNYTLKATNECGGAETQTVALHIVGSIEPGALSMRSVYFQTDRPGSLKSEAALLASEKQALQTIAEEFKKYLTSNPMPAFCLLAMPISVDQKPTTSVCRNGGRNWPSVFW